MRFLFTADFQAEWQILDICRKAWKHIVEVAVERRLEGIVVAGDLKRAYNPVDVRVIKFWQWAIVYAREHDLKVLVLLGNHDRIGQYSDDKNWLSILDKAGATVFDTPYVFDVKDGRLAMLPYMSSVSGLKKAAEKLTREIRSNRQDVLVFHTDLNRAKYNKAGFRSEAKIHVEDLYPSQYLACIGGHIHLPQKIGDNVYYAGSPFATDWGEANQRKSYLVVEGSHVTRVASIIPGWYDESWPDFPRADDHIRWEGAKVRLHVPVDVGRGCYRVLERAAEKARRDFSGASIFTIPVFRDRPEVRRSRIRISDPDDVKIKAYVKKNLPEEMELESTVEYLLARLGKVSSTKRSETGIRLVKAWARNFLPFEKVRLEFKPGITLVQGRNEDRQKNSNGSGKTSLLQIAPVAMFGTTFKGQKYDGWANRRTTGEARCGVVFEDARRRMAQIVRARRPSSLHLTIAGVDQSSGLRGDAKDATQGLIEQVSGFTWQTFANAVYIDQEVTRAFLSGKRKEQTEVLSRFQNLERFAQAQILVRKDKNGNRDQRKENELELSHMLEMNEQCERDLTALRKQKKKDERELQAKLKEAEETYESSITRYQEMKEVCDRKVQKLEKKVSSVGRKIERYSKQVSELEFEIRELESWLVTVGHLYKDKTCPTCYQHLDHKLLEKMKKKWQARLDYCTGTRDEVVSLRAKGMREELDLEAEAERISGRLGKAIDAKIAAKAQFSFARKQYTALQQSELDEGSIIKAKEKELEKWLHRKKVLKRVGRQLEEDAKLYEFAETAFGRDGIPAFLNALLVEPLNQAALHYAELFADQTIQLRFSVEEGEFQTEVVNATGGESLKDQSEGEKALAGLIASFALREVAPKCNVLILDEPGNGLDPQTARKFAASLRILQKKFECIYVTTHNLAILSELAGEKQITVVKRNGMSKIV